MKNTLRAAGQWVVDRAQEKTTWAGLAAAVATMPFIPHASDVAAQIPAIGGGIAAVILIVIKEKSK